MGNVGLGGPLCESVFLQEPTKAHSVPLKSGNLLNSDIWLVVKGFEGKNL